MRCVNGQQKKNPRSEDVGERFKPIVPGHVLVVPKRSVPRDKQLTEEESTDLWLSVRKVAAVIEREHGA